MRLMFTIMAAAAASAALASAANAQDAAAGKAAYASRCAGCHQIGAASGPMAPSLKGVYGRKIAGLGDFNYSTALKGKGGTWTAAGLDAFLASPVKFAPGGKMYAAVTAPADRANLIAYLKTVK